MQNSPITIEDHLPYFIDYCQERGLSANTQINYQRYLNKFILWLKISNKETLLPNELTLEDVASYIDYLQNNQPNGRPLSSKTQFYYLVALRAFMGYFELLGIHSLKSDKIKLPKAFKGQIRPYTPNAESIDNILTRPEVADESGLRDRLILELLIKYGLKSWQIQQIDRNQITKIKNITPSTTSLFEQYLKQRTDVNNALFINYSPGDRLERLTVRSIERIVKKYLNKNETDQNCNARNLRGVFMASLWDTEITIKEIYCHYEFSTRDFGDYWCDFPIVNHLARTASDKWNDVEAAIQKEFKFLKENISVVEGQYRNENHVIKCDDCIFKKLATLIVSGKIKVALINGFKKSDKLWAQTLSWKNDSQNRHGSDWHRQMMDIICDFFRKNGCTLDIEPDLNLGRADLGLVADVSSVFIEVGTVSLFKLWYNLSTMDNVRILIIPDEFNVIEFSVNEKYGNK